MSYLTLKCIKFKMSYLTLKCIKFNFGWGSAPDPTAGAYSAPSDLLAGFNRSYFQWE